MRLNDFGTAAGDARLSSESKVGAYTLRVQVAGVLRIVPEAFQVKYYRRPNFEIEVGGVPDKITAGQVLGLQVVLPNDANPLG